MNFSTWFVSEITSNWWKKMYFSPQWNWFDLQNDTFSGKVAKSASSLQKEWKSSQKLLLNWNIYRNLSTWLFNVQNHTDSQLLWILRCDRSTLSSDSLGGKRSLKPQKIEILGQKIEKIWALDPFLDILVISPMLKKFLSNLVNFAENSLLNPWGVIWDASAYTRQQL